MTETNHRILLRSRPTGSRSPATSSPTACRCAHPPRMRCCCRRSSCPSIRRCDHGCELARRCRLGDVMRGGGIARVLESRAGSFQPRRVGAGASRLADLPDLAGEIPAKGRSCARRRAGLDRSARPQCRDRLFRHARYRRSEAGRSGAGVRCGRRRRADRRTDRAHRGLPGGRHRRRRGEVRLPVR